MQGLIGKIIMFYRYSECQISKIEDNKVTLTLTNVLKDKQGRYQNQIVTDLKKVLACIELYGTK